MTAAQVSVHPPEPVPRSPVSVFEFEPDSAEFEFGQFSCVVVEYRTHESLLTRGLAKDPQRNLPPSEGKGAPGKTHSTEPNDVGNDTPDNPHDSMLPGEGNDVHGNPELSNPSDEENVIAPGDPQLCDPVDKPGEGRVSNWRARDRLASWFDFIMKQMAVGVRCTYQSLVTPCLQKRSRPPERPASQSNKAYNNPDLRDPLLSSRDGPSLGIVGRVGEERRSNEFTALPTVSESFWETLGLGPHIGMHGYHHI